MEWVAGKIRRVIYLSKNITRVDAPGGCDFSAVFIFHEDDEGTQEQKRVETDSAKNPPAGELLYLKLMEIFMRP